MSSIHVSPGGLCERSDVSESGGTLPGLGRYQAWVQYPVQRVYLEIRAKGPKRSRKSLHGLRVVDMRVWTNGVVPLLPQGLVVLRV